MKIFVIHRFEDKKQAKKNLIQLMKKASLDIKFKFLKSNIKNWQQYAKKEIKASEAVIIYNTKSCNQSDNSKWEIELAKIEKKNIIEIENFHNDKAYVKSELCSLYNFQTEFDDCFLEDSENSLEFYKLMIDSSEQLIQRRQQTNTFFITIIGVLVTIATFLFDSKTADGNSLFILYGFAAVGVLLCISWHNLISNYGKLNKAKFDVILRLEEKLGAMIYSAEWIALGKGLRSKKYRSFTSTEKNVPIYFALLIGALTIALTIWYWVLHCKV